MLISPLWINRIEWSVDINSVVGQKTHTSTPVYIISKTTTSAQINQDKPTAQKSL